LRGRRDRIPALRRKGSRESKRPEKISRFCLEEKILNLIFVVPKANKEGVLLSQVQGGQWFFEIMK
jgi:hypothetical protein